MANHKTGAQRRNDRLFKIFEDAKILNKKWETINAISMEFYGKSYNDLPDDGAEQDCIMAIYLNQQEAQ
jgi:hypothetical protein